jgi:hypothetical protein
MASKRTSAEWAKLVREWKVSGLTAREFSKRKGLNPQTLSWWKWRLGAEVSSRKPAVPKPPKRAALVPVQVVAVDSRVSAETPVEVVLGEVVVRVRRGFDAGTLARVLDVVEGEEC